LRGKWGTQGKRGTDFHRQRGDIVEFADNVRLVDRDFLVVSGRITRFSARKIIIRIFPREFLKWNLKNGVISPPRISLTPKRAPKPQLECQFFVRVGIWMNETRWWRKAMERSVTAGSDCSEIGGSEVVTVIRIFARGFFL